MAKKVKMEDIAKKLGVSKNTISLALRNMPVISEQTRELVHNTAREMGYVYEKKSDIAPDDGGRLKNICLLLPRSVMNVEFFSYIQFGIEKEARKHHLNVILVYMDGESFTETPLCIRQGIVDGIITLGRFTLDTVEAIRKFGLPVVVADMYYDCLAMDYILTDNISGCYRMTEYLIKKGHQRIGFLGDLHYASSFYDRYQGYIRAMEAFGLEVRKEWSILHGAGTYRELADQVAEMKANLPGAIVCANDALAISLLKSLEELSVQVPQMVSVTGFDNIPRSEECVPGLTTMHVQKELMGEKAVQRLMVIMKNREAVPVKTLLCTILIERESVQKLDD